MSKKLYNSEGNCSLCGNRLGWYESKWVDQETGKIYCAFGKSLYLTGQKEKRAIKTDCEYTWGRVNAGLVEIPENFRYFTDG